MPGSLPNVEAACACIPGIARFSGMQDHPPAHLAGMERHIKIPYNGPIIFELPSDNREVDLRRKGAR
jgi:hypothetical protein